MAEMRYFTCDIKGCDHIQAEEVFGQGPKDFGRLTGITLIDDDTGARVSDPMLCPGHRAMVADFIDGLKGPPQPIQLFPDEPKMPENITRKDTEV